MEVQAAIDELVAEHPEAFPEGVPDPVLTTDGWDMRLRAPWADE